MDAMARRPAPQPSSQTTSRAYQRLTLVTVVVTFGLVALGGVVRVTDSGLGCPDWPLCNGRLLPPLESGPMLEYSHRLTASVTGLLVAATALATWRSYPRRRWLLAPAGLALLLVVVQALVGGATVVTDLSPNLVLLHLGLAEALIATLLVVVLVALRGDPSPSLLRAGGAQGRLAALALGTGLATYGLLLLGSYVTVSGAGSACGDAWPLCQGQGLLPESQAAAVHMLHRAMTLVAGLLLAATFASAWGQRQRQPELLHGSVMVAALLLIQVLVGAANVWLGSPAATKLLHLTMGTAVWMAVVNLSILALTAPKADPRSVEHA
jgi:heme A synthase